MKTRIEREGIRPSAWGLFIAAPAMLATNILVARIAAGWLPPMTLNCGRWLLTGLLAFGIGGTAFRRSARAISKEWFSLFILGAVGMALCGSAGYLAGQHTTAVNIGLIYTSSPILMVLLARFFFGEKLIATRLLGVLGGLAGVGIIISRGELNALLSLQFNRGDLWALAGAVSWGLYTFLLQCIRTALDVATRFACLCLTGALTSIPFALAEFASEQTFPLSLSSIFLLALTVVVASYGGYVCHAKLQQAVGVVLGGMTSYVMPVFAALYGWLFMHEWLHPYHFAGMALIFAGVWLVSRIAPNRRTNNDGVSAPHSRSRVI